jgi:uncharacterized protein
MQGTNYETLMTLTLASITVYPVKSAAGMALPEWEVDQFGLRYDRRWMVVNPAGEFLSQRTHPRLALVTTAILNGTLRLEAPGMGALDIPLDPQPTVHTSVRVWKDRCGATWTGEGPARWFSDFLGTPCSLVRMPEETLRPADRTYAPEGTRVSFADAFPFLIISEASLSDLNRRLAEPVPMNRFRPNLVISGAEPYAEDDWDRLEINGIRLRVVKPCARCLITTTDQATAERSKEPLRTLGGYRKRWGKVMFGQNAVHETVGRLRGGDRVLAWGSS